jgi:hypothetical protein
VDERDHLVASGAQVTPGVLMRFHRPCGGIGLAGYLAPGPGQRPLGVFQLGVVRVVDQDLEHDHGEAQAEEQQRDAEGRGNHRLLIGVQGQQLIMDGHLAADRRPVAEHEEDGRRRRANRRHPDHAGGATRRGLVRAVGAPPAVPKPPDRSGQDPPGRDQADRHDDRGKHP